MIGDEIHERLSDETHHDGVVISHSSQLCRVINPSDPDALPDSIDGYRIKAVSDNS